jgi:hypothetical protein
VIPTAGTSLAGALAASLGAVEVRRLLSSERDSAAAGYEVMLDARHHAHHVTRLTRTPDCRFSHERWPVEEQENPTLAEALSLAGGDVRDAGLRVPGHAFVTGLVCAECQETRAVWRLRASLEPADLACRRCGRECPVRGFDLLERLSADRVPSHLLERPLDALGLRPGEVFAVTPRSGPTRYFELRPTLAPGATVVLAGLGNVGSFLAPYLARMSEVDALVLCDFDVYADGQELAQDVDRADAGRSKVSVQAERLARIRPTLPIHAFARPLEDLPLGVLRGAIAVSCVDSLAARLHLAERAFWMGSAFVDTAVGGGESLLVRANVYVPDEGAPCFECAFGAEDYDSIDQRYPCETD